MYICVTYVDAKTNVPCYEAPMAYGPSLPKVKDLTIEWADESNWPLEEGEYPLFYGTCAEDADIEVEGVIHKLSKQEYDTLKEAELSARKITVITARQARLALLDSGLYDKVIEGIKALPVDKRKRVEIEFEYSTEVHRNSPFVDEILVKRLKKTPQQVDELFTLASTL